MILLTVTPMSDFLTNAASFFTVITDGAKSVATLFTVWPINLGLGIMILGVGVGLIKAFSPKTKR